MFLSFSLVVPEPVAFYPLNARYKAAEKENRQPNGILGDVSITNGPYNEPGGAYLFLFRAWGLYMWIVHGKFLIRIVKRSFQRLTGVRTAKVLPVGKWVHVAGSYDRNTGINSLYINGRPSDSNNIGKGHKILTMSSRVRMGTKGDENQTYFKGKIARMKVYDVALNEAQIKTSIRQGR